MPVFKKKYNKLSDEQLMEFIQHHETAAFNELYNRYSRRLLCYFFRMLGGNEQKAQDFLQDIFLKIVEHPDLFDPQKKFYSWIFSIAYNLCKNEYRRLEVRKVTENNPNMDFLVPGFDDKTNSVDMIIDLKIFKSALLTELEKFDLKQRSVFLLRYQQEFSIREISEVLGCSEGTVKSRLFYTTKKLAHKLQDFNPYKVEGL